MEDKSVYASEDKAMKRLANMFFNQHGGRRGTRSASSWSAKALRDQAKSSMSIRPGPIGMGIVSPGKPTLIPSGHEAHEGRTPFSHLHQLHETYNEK